MLGEGIGRDGGGPGLAWAEEGRSGQERRAWPEGWALLRREVGVQRIGDEVPAKRKSAGACHCLRND